MSQEITRQKKFLRLHKTIQTQIKDIEGHNALVAKVKNYQQQLFNLNKPYFEGFLKEFNDDFQLQQFNDIKLHLFNPKKYNSFCADIKSTLSEMKKMFGEKNLEKDFLKVKFENYVKHDRKLQQLLDEMEIQYSIYKNFYEKNIKEILNKISDKDNKVKTFNFNIDLWSKKIRRSMIDNQKQTENYIRQARFKIKWYYILFPVLTAIIVGLFAFSLFY